jgi:hypothetical protein
MGILKDNGRYSKHNPAVPDTGPRRARAFTPFGNHSFEPPFFPDPNDPHQPTSLDIRGKIGQTVFQKSIPPPWATWYPRVPSLQRRRHVIPRDPRTHAQLLCRARWAAGVAAWKNLTAAQWIGYNDIGKDKEPPITGLMYFMKEWCMIHQPEEYELQALLWTAQPELPFLK